jgi:predicted amidohydrolase
VWQNVRIAQELVFESAVKGANLVVLPELCVIEPDSLRTQEDAGFVSQTRDGYITRAIQEVLSGFDCHVVLGYVELDEGLLYNSAVCLDSRGVIANARKHNLEGQDHMWASAGESLHPVVLVAENRLGIIIGRDSMNQYRRSHPYFRDGLPFYRKGAVDVIAHVTDMTTESYPPTQWMELAESTGANVIVANRLHDEEQRRGGSCIVDRTLNVWTNGSSFVSEAVVGGILL